MVNELSLKIKLTETISINKEYIAIGSDPKELTRFVDPVDNIMKIYNLLITQERMVKFSIPEQVDPAKVEAAAKASKGLSSASNFMSMGSDILSFLGIVLSSDQSGATAKFS